MLGQNKDSNFISSRRMIAVIILAYLGLAALAGLPYLGCGNFSLVDAFFEGMSTVTLTGCTTVLLPGSLPGWVLVWRSVMQWVCGYFTILLFIMALPKIFHNSMCLFNGDLGDYHNWRILPDGCSACRNFALLYAGFTVLVFCGLMFLGVPVWEGFHYACGVVSTAGFNLQDGAVLQGLGDGAKIFMAAAMLLAGGNYLFYYALFKQQAGKKTDEEFSFYIGFVLVAAVFVICNMWYVGYEGAAWTDVFCQVASFASTTGYMFTDCNTWPVFSRFALACFCFTGACAGSTAGGLKMVRCLILLKQFNWDVNAVFHPKMLEGVPFNGKRISSQVCYAISFYFFAHLLMVCLVALGLALNDCSSVEAFFTAGAALANSGGIMSSTALGGNFANFTWAGKVFLMLGMLVGRLEIFMPLALFLPEFWHKDKKW